MANKFLPQRPLASPFSGYIVIAFNTITDGLKPSAHLLLLQTQVSPEVAKKRLELLHALLQKQIEQKKIICGHIHIKSGATLS